MAFKSLTNFDSERYKGFFRLQNDNDYADVVFLYRGIQDVMVAECHYIKSVDYSGYVQCIGNGTNCPACQKGIRKNTEIFIPLYVINSTDPSFNGPEIVFWDRTLTIQPQLQSDVFKNYPDPSKYVFRIIRHGVPRDRNTRYEIRAIQNSPYTYDQICARANIAFPAHYNTICRDVTPEEMTKMLADGGGTGEDSMGFQPIPRGGFNIPEGSEPIINNAAPGYGSAPIPDFSAAPVITPPVNNPAPQTPPQMAPAPAPAPADDTPPFDEAPAAPAPAPAAPATNGAPIPELPEGEVSF